jgi:acyl carrier protein
MPEDLENSIKNIAVEILELPPAALADEGQFDRLLQTIESVAMLEILVTLERTYQIQLFEDEIKALRTWRQLIELVRRKIAAKQT